jgi:hypothetical protein
MMAVNPINLMTMRIFLFLLMIPGPLFAQHNIRIFQLDPLEKVLKDRAYFVDQPDTIRVAKGETATLQLVIKSKTDLQKTAVQVTSAKTKENSQDLKPSQVGFVGYVGLGRTVPSPGRDQLVSPSGYFPDPIFTDSTFNLSAGEPQPIWITIPVPTNASPGIYRGSVKVSALSSGKSINQNRTFVIKVYPVTIAETSLWVTNWIHHTPESLSFLNNGKPVVFYTERYWELIGLIAQRIKGTGQNVVMLPVQTLVQYKIEGDKYSFDFAHLDRMVSIYQKAGVLKRMAGSHVGYRMGDWTSQFGVDVPLFENGKISMQRMSISDSRAKNYLDQFFPALMTHLKLKGLDKNYMQHVSDEPVAENIGSYKAIAAYVKKLIPGTKIIDANIGSDLIGSIDVWVPVLDQLHKEYDFYKKRQKAGDEVWFYTCLGPQGNYANRFIEQPLIMPRLLHWLNYKYGVTGYLHWGLTAWHMPYRKDLYQDVTGMFDDGNVVPGGDSYIVYPAYNKLYSSIRLEAMRDGINDFELLRQLEKKDPDLAKRIVNTTVFNFDHYDVDVKAFRDKRKLMLERLSR